MNIEKSINDNTVIMKLDGWLDTTSANELQAQLEALEPDTMSLILDLDKLEYISSAGLRQFVAAHKRVNGSLVLTHVHQEVMDVLHMAGFDKRLHIEP